MNSTTDQPYLKSRFFKATGDRDWHTNYSIPANWHVDSYEWVIKLEGNNVTHFGPYEIKFNRNDESLDVSFGIKDTGDIPYDGDGSKIVMYLFVTPPPP